MPKNKMKKIIKLHTSSLIYRTDPFVLGCGPGLHFNTLLSLIGSQVMVLCDTLLYINIFIYKEIAYRSIFFSFLSTMSTFIVVSEGKLHKPRKQKRKQI